MLSQLDYKVLYYPYQIPLTDWNQRFLNLVGLPAGLWLGLFIIHHYYSYSHTVALLSS